MEIFTFILNNSNKCTQLNTLKAHFRALITNYHANNTYIKQDHHSNIR